MTGLEADRPPERTKTMELIRAEKVGDPTLDPVAIEAFKAFEQEWMDWHGTLAFGVFEQEWLTRRRIVTHRERLKKRKDRFRRAGAAKHKVLGCSLCGFEEGRYTVARLAWTEVHICSECVAHMQVMFDGLTAEREAAEAKKIAESTILFDDDDAWPPAEDAAQ
jgi:hypothetical protein